jgi:hypothetical protein
MSLLSFPIQPRSFVIIYHLSCKDILLSICSCCCHLEHRASVKRFVSFQFLSLRLVRLLGRWISPSQAPYLRRATKTQNKRRQTSKPLVGFELTIPVFERAKTCHALETAHRDRLYRYCVTWFILSSPAKSYTGLDLEHASRNQLSKFLTLNIRKVAGSIPDEVIGFFNWPNPSSRTMALGSTQPLWEMSTRNLSAGKGLPARKADNLTAICKVMV